jgi:hypothetical protein
MSTLRVRVDKFLEAEGGPPPRVYARIQRLDERGRAVADTLEHVLVPISHLPQQAEDIPLVPGLYAVDVKLPSGEWLSDAVQLEEGSTRDLVLVGATPSREWLSWQHLGNAVREPTLTSKNARRSVGGERASPRTPRMSESPTRTTRGPVVKRTLTERTKQLLERVGLKVDVDGLSSRHREPEAPWEPDRVAEIDVARPLYWMPGGPNRLTAELLRQDPWRALASMRGSTAHIVEMLNGGREAQLVLPAEQDAASALFPVPNRSMIESGIAPFIRAFAAVHRRMGVELVCLPVPWVDQLTDRQVSIEVSVQRPRWESEFASAVTVRDQQLAILLGFLSSGALPSAKRLAETAGEMLYEKTVNPLAAAAGGYALVSSAADAQPQRWHRWVDNLAHMFPELPDGAIQYATMRLRLRTGESDIREATEAFKQAYRRGLPYYGLGMRWLLEGLQRVGTRDEEAKAMAELVQGLTARLHPQSAFTILRLGRH